LQSAASRIPTPCKYRLSLKDEVHINKTHTHTYKNTIEGRKEIISRAVFAVS